MSTQPETLGAEEKEQIRLIVRELMSFIYLRQRTNRPVSLRDFSSGTTETGEMAGHIDTLLETVGIAKTCSSETVWELLDRLDETCDDPLRMIPEEVRETVVININNELDQQDNEVAERLDNLLSFLEEVQAIPTNSATDDQQATAEKLKRQGAHAKQRLLKFISGHPSLLTPAVQVMLARSSELDLVSALIQAVPGNLDFVAQNNIIDAQGRLRNKRLLMVMQDLRDTGLAAVELFELGFADILSLMENTEDWTTETLDEYRKAIEKRAFQVIKEFNQVHRSEIIRSQEQSEQAIEDAKNHILLELISHSRLAYGLAAEIIRVESQLHQGIRPLVQALEKKKQSLEQGNTIIQRKARKLLDNQVLTIANEIAQLQNQHATNRRELESDVFREDHYRTQLNMLARRIKEKQAAQVKQEEMHKAILSRLKDISTTQAEIINRLITRILTLEKELFTQSKAIFSRLLTTDLSSERQVEIIQFGDQDLALELIESMGENLAAEAQMAIGKSKNRVLQSKMLDVLGNKVVAFARHDIFPDLLLGAIEDTDLLRGVRF